MGKERDKLIRSLGGVPLSDQGLSDEEIMRRRMARFAEEGRLPPEIQTLRDRGEVDPGARVQVVGYGTLLSRASLAETVGGAAEGREYQPVVVEGFRRSFNLRPEHYEPSFQITDEPLEVGALNVQPREGHRFNGLLYSVTLEELSALDERERYYRRVEAPAVSFGDGEPLGRAFVYSAGPGSPWVVDDPSQLRPHWRDVLLSREGAYAVSQSFGEMFDQTTWLAGGEVLAVEALRDHLPDLQGGAAG